MGKRQETREKVEAEIIELGRRHLVTEGAAGLSLRAVARDLGMVSSAVYRYVTSRDEYVSKLKPIGIAYRAVMGHHYPVMTAVQVMALMESQAKVEIEATAVIPDVASS